MENIKKTAEKKVSTKKVKNSPISHGVGRRKASTVSVWLRKGRGNIIVNGRDYKEYFDTEVSRMEATTPVRIYEDSKYFDYDIKATGGGVYGQAGAVKLGIARALVEFNKDLKPLFRQHGLLTVDSRLKERKKYGQKAARRKFQFVKR